MPKLPTVYAKMNGAVIGLAERVEQRHRERHRREARAVIAARPTQRSRLRASFAKRSLSSIAASFTSQRANRAGDTSRSFTPSRMIDRRRAVAHEQHEHRADRHAHDRRGDHQPARVRRQRRRDDEQRRGSGDDRELDREARDVVEQDRAHGARLRDVLGEHRDLDDLADAAARRHRVDRAARDLREQRVAQLHAVGRHERAASRSRRAACHVHSNTRIAIHHQPMRCR